MPLPNIDFDALRLFVQLYRTESLSRAADLSWITPSGASHTLTRLRKLFGDPLFIRHGQGMRPTQRARDIYPLIIDTLNRFADIIDPPPVEPNLRHKTFRIACYETNVITLMRTTVKALENSHSPNTVLDIRLVHDNLWQDLETGVLDFAVLPVTGSREGFHIERICPDPYVYVTDQLHPLLSLQKQRNLSQKDIRQYGIVKLQVPTHSSADDGSCLLFNEDTPEGVRIRSSFVLSNFGLISGTTLIAQVPLTVAVAAAPQWNLQILGRPVHGVEHPLSIIWHESKHKDPASQWLRAVMMSSYRDFPKVENVPLIHS